MQPSYEGHMKFSFALRDIELVVFKILHFLRAQLPFVNVIFRKYYL